MTRLILDTDPGVDDAMAIAFALAHPDIELVALTTVFGNAGVDVTTRNAQYLLDVFAARDVAVARGAAAPLVQPPLPPAEVVHGADGLGNVHPGDAFRPRVDARHARLEALDAADFIVAEARAAPGELTLAAVGPLTNLALALAREPALPDLVAALVVMGGALDEPGNVSPVAEANFLGDPHAADVVLGADWPATVVGLDVTHRIMLGEEHLARLRDAGGATGELIWRASRFYVDFYTARARAAGEGDGRPACAMHDAAALVRLVAPDAFETLAGPARVAVDGVAAGALVLDRRGVPYLLPHWRERPSVSVCTDVDAERVRALFLDTLSGGHGR